MKIKIGSYPNWRFYHNWLYDWFGYTPKQKTSIRIDRYDTWSMDHTLAPIILPMLKQLKETKHGAPRVDWEDVPEELRPPKEQISKMYTHGEEDDNYFKRWDWVIDEMIGAFEQKRRIDGIGDFYGGYTEDQKNGPMAGSFEWIDHEGIKAHQERMTNGFKLFGKYYESLWD